MGAKFYQRLVTCNGKKFNTKFYIAAPQDFCIEPAGKDAQVWANEGAFGTNASFFAPQADGTGYMSALHIFRNKNMGQAGGNNNTEVLNDSRTAMDFLYYNKVSNTYGLRSKTASWSTSNNHGIPNMEWGIGGYNLLLDKTFSTTDKFLEGLKGYYPNFYYNRAGVFTSRTVIGVRKDGSIILAAVFGSNLNDPMKNGPSMYEVHLLMKYFGCTKALCLDGSDCTKISYKKNGTATAITNGKRSTYCRIRLLASAAASCDWTGV